MSASVPRSGRSNCHISVVIPTYHRNDLLAKCLDCLIPGVQSLPADQYEVIVTDDGSKTTAEQMLREQYPWAKWVAGPRKGPAANRNNGTKHANGECIAFTDDDCLPSPSWLEAFLSTSTSDVDVYEGKTTCEEGVPSPLYEAPINLTGDILWSCNMMVRRTTFQELGGFDENFPYPAMEDADLCIRIRAAGHQIVFVLNAIVDHPPRRSRWGSQYAKLLESHVYLWCKTGNQRSFRRGVLMNIFKSRLRRIMGFPLTLASFFAFTSWVVEVMYALQNVDRWESKYRCQFPTPSNVSV